MSKANQRKFRQERSDDLSRLKRILDDSKILSDTSQIQTAITTCKTSTQYGNDSWNYSITDLTFDIDPRKGFKKTKPEFIQEQNSKLRLFLSVNLAGKCKDVKIDFFDPFINLEINIVVKTADKKYICAWHFDRHIQNDAEESYFCHPFYHFQYGGKKITELPNMNYGNHILLESPRIAHPPLDGILAIDFVLAHYLGEDWRQLRFNERYNELIRKSADLFWLPYAKSTSEYLSNPLVSQQWSANKIYPQLNWHK